MLLKNKKTFIDLAILLGVAILIRIGYLVIHPYLNIFPDTYGYYEIGQNMLRSPSLRSWINPFRPPLYPIFLNAIVAATGHFGVRMVSPEYFIGEQYIGFIQTVVNIIGIIIFYFMLRKLFTSRLVILGMSIFQAISINAIIWERSVLSESFSIPITFIMGFLMIYALTSPTWLTVLFITFFSIIGVLFRPATIIYPFIIFPFIAYYHKKLPALLRCIVAGGLFILFILGYAKINEMNWGYFGIQNGGDINMLARIMQFRLPLTPAKNFQPLYDQVKAYTVSTNKPDVWIFLNTYNVDTYSSTQNIIILRKFDMAIINAYPFAYALHGLADIPASFLVTDEHYAFAPTNIVRSIFYALSIVFRLTQYIYITSIPFILVAWIRLLFKKISRKEAGITLLGTFSYGTVVLYVLTGTGYYDYARFYSTVQPFLTLFSLYWWVIIGKHLRTWFRHFYTLSQ